MDTTLLPIQTSTKDMMEGLRALKVNIYPGYYNFVHYYPPLSELPPVRDLKAIESFIEAQKHNIGLYYHIPFCTAACTFCYYTKQVDYQKEIVESYLKSLEMETQHWGRYLHNCYVHSVYIGGGTPSCLSTYEIEYLIKMLRSHFYFPNETEFVFEVSPETFDEERLNTLLDLGVNRISIGIQTLDNALLKKTKRQYSAEEAIEKVQLLKGSLIKTFNIDFMYGLKGQTREDIRNCLKLVEILEPPSVTFYQRWFLTNNKRYAESRASKETQKRGDQDLREILLTKELIYQSMRKMGYTTDNLCWFVKNSSDACDHFRFRWNDNSYVGIGQSAYGYINGVAYQNTKKIISYRNFLKNNSLPITKGKVTTEEERATRAAILGLKTNAGVCLRDIEKRYEVQLKPKVEKQLKQLVKLNVFSIDDDRLSFTEKGLFWGDCVLSSFMDEPMFYLSRRRRP